MESTEVWMRVGGILHAGGDVPVLDEAGADHAPDISCAEGRLAVAT